MRLSSVSSPRVQLVNMFMFWLYENTMIRKGVGWIRSSQSPEFRTHKENQHSASHWLLHNDAAIDLSSWINASLGPPGHHKCSNRPSVISNDRQTTSLMAGENVLALVLVCLPGLAAGMRRESMCTDDKLYGVAKCEHGFIHGFSFPRDTPWKSRSRLAGLANGSHYVNIFRTNWCL